MEFIEYSLESLHDESIRLAKRIEGDGYRPDCVAYLARGGWIIGKAVAEYFGVPLIELSAHRKGDSAKDYAAVFLSRIPRSIRIMMRSLEIRNRLSHDDGDSQRKSVHLTSRYPIPNHINRILLVDDAADTGASIVAGRGILSEAFPKAMIMTAVINVFGKALMSAHIDWWLYEDCLLCLPSSKDSKEYDQFIALYEAKEL